MSSAPEGATSRGNGDTLGRRRERSDFADESKTGLRKLPAESGSGQALVRLASEVGKHPIAGFCKGRTIQAMKQIITKSNAALALSITALLFSVNPIYASGSDETSKAAVNAMIIVPAASN